MPSSRSVTVDEFITAEAGGWGRFQRRAELKLGVNYAYIAADNLAGIFLVESLKKSGWSLDLVQEQALKSWFYFGGLVGFLVSGPYADARGRRAALLLFNAVRCVAALLCFAAPSFP